jgi:hypothetical protein
MAAILLWRRHGHGSDSMPASETNGTSQVPVALVSAIATEAAATGARWIAESVAVALEESAPTLEQEMELAAAAQVAAESARNEVAAAAAEVPATAPVVEAAEATVAAEVSVTEAVASADTGTMLVSAEAGLLLMKQRAVLRKRCCQAVLSSAAENQVPEASLQSRRRFRQAASVGDRRTGIRSCRGCRRRAEASPRWTQYLDNRFAGDTRDRGCRTCGSHAAARSPNWLPPGKTGKIGNRSSAPPSAPTAGGPVAEAITVREEAAAPPRRRRSETEAAELEGSQ